MNLIVFGGGQYIGSFPTPGMAIPDHDDCVCIFVCMRSARQGYYVFCIVCRCCPFTHVQGIRHGGLTPASAPRMPVITEDVVQARRGRKCDRVGTAKGYIKN